MARREEESECKRHERTYTHIYVYTYNDSSLSRIVTPRGSTVLLSAGFPFSRAIVCARVCCVFITCADYSGQYHANMGATPVLSSMLANVSPPILVLLTTLIAGGIGLLIRYVVNRRSRSSLEQDSSKSKHLRSSIFNCIPIARTRRGTFVLLAILGKFCILSEINIYFWRDQRSEGRDASKTNVPSVMPLHSPLFAK